LASKLSAAQASRPEVRDSQLKEVQLDINNNNRTVTTLVLHILSYELSKKH